VSYSINYLEDKNIIYIEMKGRINFGLAEQYSKDSLKIARDENCSKFIIDHKQTILNSLDLKILIKLQLLLRI
jgi:hypothetical protein